MTSLSASSHDKIFLTANGKTVTATLEQNEATAHLLSLLNQGPVTLSMRENGGFEKVGTLPESLPTSDVRQNAGPGDIMLYLGDVMCIFYGSNTWAYTRLGKIDNLNAAEIKDFLSGEPVSVVLSVDDSTFIEHVSMDSVKNKKIYDLTGNQVSPEFLKPGIYIVDGNKTFLK